MENRILVNITDFERKKYAFHRALKISFLINLDDFLFTI